jgi:hypothetical protein
VGFKKKNVISVSAEKVHMPCIIKCVKRHIVISECKIFYPLVTTAMKTIGSTKIRY